MLLSLMLVPVLVASGIAIDSSRQLNLKAHLQSAADAAALAGAKSYAADLPKPRPLQRPAPRSMQMSKRCMIRRRARLTLLM